MSLLTPQSEADLSVAFMAAAFVGLLICWAVFEACRWAWLHPVVQAWVTALGDVQAPNDHGDPL